MKKRVKSNIFNVSCINCDNEKHKENDCKNKSDNVNKVNFVGNFRRGNQQINPYSTTYNS